MANLLAVAKILPPPLFVPETSSLALSTETPKQLGQSRLPRCLHVLEKRIPSKYEPDSHSLEDKKRQLYPFMDVGTGFLAGRSVCLMVQACLPCLFVSRGECKLVLKGGTNCDMAPQIDYFSLVLFPTLVKMGVHVDLKICKRGYYPKGGGEIEIVSKSPTSIKPINLVNRGDVTKIYGRAFVAGVLPLRMAQEMSSAASGLLQRQYYDLSIHIDALKEPEMAAFGNGSGIILVAETSTGCILSGSSLGKRGVNPEQVGVEAAQELLDNLDHGGCVDDHMQDQLILYMAMSSGHSIIKTGPLTLHTETSIHVAQLFTGATFKVSKESRGCTISCQGAGIC